MTGQQKRTEAVAHAAFLASNQKHISYELGGGLSWVELSMAEMQARFNKGEVWTPDCRASIDWIARQSGWRPFGGYGYAASSGEMWEVLPHIPEVDTHPGSLVTYGAGGDKHVCMIVRSGWVFSLGSAFNAHIISLADETAGHPGEPVTFLKVEGLLR